MMGFMPPERVEFMRGVLAAELGEWFEDGYTERPDPDPPPWMWFVFSDAGIGCEQIAQLVEEEDEEDAKGFFWHANEQVLSANTRQIQGYAAARSAWLEMP